MEIQLRPLTAYMTKPSFVSLKRKDLSPNRARLDEQRGEAAMISRIRVTSSAEGGEVTGRAGRRRRAPAKASAPTTTPRLARKKRGALPSSVNCHHNSLEYSMCRWTKIPTQMDAVTAVAMLKIQPSVSGSRRTAEWR